MEFFIDLATVRNITRQEEAQAREEIAGIGAIGAYQQSLRRHDERLARASDASTLACKAGCSWCCHFSVDIRPVEAFNILEHMQIVFSAEQRDSLAQQMVANSKILGHLDDMQRMQHTLKCPFLMQDKCGIYEARPQTCRNYHATNSAGCQQSYEEPDNLDIAPEFAPLVYQSGGAHVDAFSKAIQDAGYDHAAYELNSAMTELLADPVGIRQRFDTRMPAFTGIQGTEVALEFIELDE